METSVEMEEWFGVDFELPSMVRQTGFAHWNRYAAVNDEFIDVHMSSAAAQAAGQPDVFGMGNLRVAYLHAVLHDWLAGRGDIAAFNCQFRALNFLEDELCTSARVTGVSLEAGLRTIDLVLGVLNQKGEETTPGTARVVVFDGSPEMPKVPDQPPAPDRAPGIYLDSETIACLGRPLEPLDALPVDANDIRRWAQAAWYPDLPPPDQFDIAEAARSPWGGLVAARDFNPFAWHPDFHPEAYPWMRGMGTEPGKRGLNGGQRTWYGAPIRVGDVISNTVTLVDAYEKEGRLGTMLFLVDESRFTNQDGETVRATLRTTIYH
jgi:hypothetical protein